MFLQPSKVENSQIAVEDILEKYPETMHARPVPVINGHVPAGFPDIPLQQEQIVDYLYLPDIPKNSLAIKVKGESMSPTIRDDDYVVFVPAGIADLTNGDVVIVRNEWNELVVKRFRIKNGEIYLTSDNPEYPTIKPNENYKIVGKVIQIVTIKKL